MYGGTQALNNTSLIQFLQTNILVDASCLWGCFFSVDRDWWTTLDRWMRSIKKFSAHDFNAGVKDL